MSDESVASALRSDHALVVVESPAGCGKTHQGAAFAREEAHSAKGQRVLILTHTHAACSVFAERTRGCSGVDIRTIDSLIGEIASAYHDALGLPADIATWVRPDPSARYAQLASKVSALLERHPFVARAIVARFATLVCDEHQDSSRDQNAVVLALHAAGARVRIFGDPVQSIFSEGASHDSKATERWSGLTARANCVEALDAPHRWSNGCRRLGEWTLAAREVLRRGGRLRLGGALPNSVSVLVAENENPSGVIFRPSQPSARRLNTFVKQDGTLMALTLRPITAKNLRSVFYRGVPLWEGHTRQALDRLVMQMAATGTDAGKLADAACSFLKAVGKGFGDADFGSILRDEIADGCKRPRRGRPGKIQELSRAIVEDPSHRGVAECLRRTHALHLKGELGDTKLDCVSEFWDAVSLRNHDDLDAAIAAVTHRRTHSRPKPPAKSISTIHKAKGLESERALVLPIDADTFPDTPQARNILYVALSRASRELMLVVSRRNPSPLLHF